MTSTAWFDPIRLPGQVSDLNGSSCHCSACDGNFDSICSVSFFFFFFFFFALIVSSHPRPAIVHSALPPFSLLPFFPSKCSVLTSSPYLLCYVIHLSTSFCNVSFSQTLCSPMLSRPPIFFLCFFSVECFLCAFFLQPRNNTKKKKGRWKKTNHTHYQTSDHLFIQSIDVFLHT